MGIDIRIVRAAREVRAVRVWWIGRREVCIRDSPGFEAGGASNRRLTWRESIPALPPVSRALRALRSSAIVIDEGLPRRLAG
jgi:hypothetical protein